MGKAEFPADVQSKTSTTRKKYLSYFYAPNNVNIRDDTHKKLPGNNLSFCVEFCGFMAELSSVLGRDGKWKIVSLISFCNSYSKKMKKHFHSVIQKFYRGERKKFPSRNSFDVNYFNSFSLRTTSSFSSQFTRKFKRKGY
jgi:hypothetical protein